MSESNRLLNFATSSELIANGEGRNVLSAIEDGLRNCDEFLISVAFITPEGLLTLKPILKELEERGVHGRVLTTDYLGFNSPKVLEDLGSLNNIDLKVYCTTQGSNHGFHTKGYIFKKDEYFLHLSIDIDAKFGYNIICSLNGHLREWRNRQTRTFEGRVVIPYGFKSRLSHQIKKSRSSGSFLFCAGLEPERYEG